MVLMPLALTAGAKQGFHRAKGERMFEPGKWYTITMIEGGDEGYSDYEVLEFEHPLLKLRGGGGEIVVNVTSPMFVRAQLSKHQGKREPLTLDINWETKRPSPR
jgi:hypothetical protein